MIPCADTNYFVRLYLPLAESEDPRACWRTRKPH
jgi:hypothetical protein